MTHADRMMVYLIAWGALIAIWGVTGELGLIITCCALAIAGRTWEWSRG